MMTLVNIFKFFFFLAGGLLLIMVNYCKVSWNFNLTPETPIRLPLHNQ